MKNICLKTLSKWLSEMSMACDRVEVKLGATMVPFRYGSTRLLLLRKDILHCQGRKRFHKGKKSL